VAKTGWKNVVNNRRMLIMNRFLIWILAVSWHDANIITISWVFGYFVLITREKIGVVKDGAFYMGTVCVMS